jgi:hypothetical protein
MAAAGCAEHCELITNPAYGFRGFAIWPLMDGLGIGLTADLGLFPRDPGPIGKGLYFGGVLEVSSGYHAPSSFSFWLGLGGFSGETGVQNRCIAASGLGAQVGLRAGTHLSDSMFASLSASGTGVPRGGCEEASIYQPDARPAQAPVQGGMALITLEMAYELAGTKAP